MTVDAMAAHVTFGLAMTLVTAPTFDPHVLGQVFDGQYRRVMVINARHPEILQYTKTRPSTSGQRHYGTLDIGLIIAYFGNCDF